MTTFKYVQPTEEQLNLMNAYREHYEWMKDHILAEIPDSRGRALALTKLEESAFWLNKGITNNT